MDFAQQQRKPTKHLIGFTVTVLLHVILIYALINGLGQKIVDVIKPPAELKIVQEVKPPPPPEKLPPPPPKMLAPPPPYIPPPEVQITTPPPAPTIAVAQNSTPTSSNIPAHVDAAPAAAAGPSKNVKVVCPNVSSVVADVTFPGKASRAGLTTGSATIEFTVTASGESKDFVLKDSSNRLFNEAAMSAARLLKCTPQGQDTRISLPVEFRTTD